MSQDHALSGCSLGRPYNLPSVLPTYLLPTPPLTHPFIHSTTHSPIRLLFHPLLHLSDHSPIHYPSVYPPTHPPIFHLSIYTHPPTHHPLTHPFTHSPIHHPSVYPPIRPFIYSPICHPFICPPTHPSVIHHPSSIHPFTLSSTHSFPLSFVQQEHTELCSGLESIRANPVPGFQEPTQLRRAFVPLHLRACCWERSPVPPPST